MRDTVPFHHPGLFEVESIAVQLFKESSATLQQDGNDVDLKLIQYSDVEYLLDGTTAV